MSISSSPIAPAYLLTVTATQVFDAGTRACRTNAVWRLSCAQPRRVVVHLLPVIDAAADALHVVLLEAVRHLLEAAVQQVNADLSGSDGRAKGNSAPDANRDAQRLLDDAMTEAFRSFAPDTKAVPTSGSR